jgi:hypothetical protein
MIGQKWWTSLLSVIAAMPIANGATQERDPLAAEFQ